MAVGEENVPRHSSTAATARAESRQVPGVGIEQRFAGDDVHHALVGSAHRAAIAETAIRIGRRNHAPPSSGPSRRRDISGMSR